MKSTRNSVDINPSRQRVKLASTEMGMKAEPGSPSVIQILSGCWRDLHLDSMYAPSHRSCILDVREIKNSAQTQGYPKWRVSKLDKGSCGPEVQRPHAQHPPSLTFFEFHHCARVTVLIYDITGEAKHLKPLTKKIAGRIT